MFVPVREPINTYTHLLGAILSIAALIALIIKAAAVSDSVITIIAASVFGISMILLYSASTLFHMVIANDRTIHILQRIDHSMIFVLIAGTYTPICLIGMQNLTGWLLFLLISALAAAGVLFKLIWFHSPRLLSTALYVGMGWLIVFFIPALQPILGNSGLFMLIAGGVFYTIGAVIYWLKPSMLSSEYLGYHEIFHIFMLFGSLCHFICIYSYVL